MNRPFIDSVSIPPSDDLVWQISLKTSVVCRVQYIIVVNLISVYGQQINDLQKKKVKSFFSLFWKKKKKEENVDASKVNS